MVPWSLCGSVLNRGSPSDPLMEVLSPIPGILGCSRAEGEESIVLSQQTPLLGFELVPYVEEEPIPLDWSQAVVEGGSGGYQAADNELDLILAVSRILGVSCDGHFEKLNEAFAHILAGRANRKAKKSVGGSQRGKKGLRELVNLNFGVNYEGGSGSVSRSRSKEKGNRIVI